MLKPLGRFILAEPIKMNIDREEATDTGIILQIKKDTREDLSAAKAKVVSVGDEVKKIKPDEVVLYNYFTGNNILIPGKDPLGKDDKEYHLIYEDDIMAKEEND